MMFSKKQVGFFAFVAGIFIAAFVAVAYTTFQPMHIYALGLLGLTIGLLNVEAKEVWIYMIAAIAFILSISAFNAMLSELPVVSTVLVRFLSALMYVIFPGVAVVALRIIYEASKNPESLPHPLRGKKKAKAKPSRRKR